MEKPVYQRKENQSIIAKKESKLRANADPFAQQVEEKENQTKITKIESELVANAKSAVQEVTQKENKKESELAASAKPLIWDCGSSLYDSFERKSFERHLDSAIHSRTLSMPHLSDRRVISHRPPPSQPQPMSKKSSTISRSFQKLLRSVFKPKAQNGNNPIFPAKEQTKPDGFYVVYDERSEVLSTIPEVPKFDGLSPELKSLVRRTASDRFTATSIGISCA